MQAFLGEESLYENEAKSLKASENYEAQFQN